MLGFMQTLLGNLILKARGVSQAFLDPVAAFALFHKWAINLLVIVNLQFCLTASPALPSTIGILYRGVLLFARAHRTTNILLHRVRP